MIMNFWRIVVVALVTLLTFAATASAECAWVLWIRTTVLTQDGKETSEGWKPNEAFTSPAECKAAEAIQVQAWERYRRRAAEPGQTSVVPMDNNYVCLPDSVDPR